MALIFGALAGSQEAGLGVARVRRSGAIVDLRVMQNGQVTSHSVRFQSDGAPDPASLGIVPVTWVSPLAASAQILRAIQDKPGFAEFKAGYSPHVASAEELSDVSYAVGREYHSHAVYELEEWPGLEGLPYFEIESDGVRYGAEAMGMGELAIQTMLWQLARIDSGIVLVEEPEMGVSPRSQGRMMDVFAKIVGKRRLWTIVSTHSPQIVERIPKGHVRAMYRRGGRSSVVARPNQRQLQRDAGLNAPKRRLVFVEDRLAQHVVEALLESLDVEIRDAVEVIAAGDRSRIRANLSLGLRSMSVVGAYDKDCEGSVEEMVHPHAFIPMLPTNEDALRSVVVGNSSGFGEPFGVSDADLNQALSGLEGLDGHDWIEGLVRTCGGSHEAVVGRMVRLWLAEATNRVSAEGFVNAVGDGL